MTASSAHPTPKHLKASYLAESETLLRETLGTPLFYLPGPILALLVVLFLDYSALTLRSASLPAVPGLTWAFGRFPTFGSYGPGNYIPATFLFFTILVVLWLGVRYARWVSTVYAITTTRVIIQRGILSRDFDQIPLLQVRGVDVHQSILDRLFGYGTVVISSESGNRQTRLGNEAWNGIPRPFELQKLIESATQSLSQSHSAPAVPAVAPAPIVAPAPVAAPDAPLPAPA
jgi:uncharacterized membrane protein YdbT with pleckstrin-like domain